MPIYRTQAIVKTTDNVAANYATNTWYMVSTTSANIGAWEGMLTDFYQDILPSMGGLVLASNMLQFKTYDMTQPEPRVPVSDIIASGSPDNTGCLPPEVSLCMSFQAPAVSGTPQARRRGRVYLPFFKSSLNGNDGRPSSTIISTLVAAGTALLAASGDGITGPEWSVYSPTDNAAVAVTEGWVDNEWDTQRRRGRPYTSRTTF